MKQSKKAFFKHHAFCISMVICICFISALLSLQLKRFGINKENVLMLYLVGVLISTVVTSGYLYGFLTSAISVVLFNYFFTDPLYSFVIDNSQDLLLIAFFLMAALICGSMSSNFKSQAVIAIKNEKQAQIMYEITKCFLKLTGTERIVQKGMEYIYHYTGYPCRVVLDSVKLGQDQAEFFFPELPREIENTKKPCSMTIKGRADQTGKIYFLTVEEFKNQEEERLISHIIYSMALVLDREYIYLEREKIKLEMESESVKSTLIRSISHDIRTPLTGIISASSLIMDCEIHFDPAEVKRLASDINEQAWWLETTVQNILDMTRIMDGRLSMNFGYESVDDLMNEAVSHVLAFADEKRLKVIYPKGIFLIQVDGKLLAQVLINLLDNAFKHSGDHSLIELKAFQEGKEMVFEVSDNGCGIEDSIYDRIFDGFVTLPTKESDRGRGVGLGLTICKAIVTALGGAITAANRKTGGAVFTVKLPYKEE